MSILHAIDESIITRWIVFALVIWASLLIMGLIVGTLIDIFILYILPDPDDPA